MKDPIQRERMLEKARRDYPKGTEYYGRLNRGKDVSRKEAKWIDDFGIEVGDDYVYIDSDQKWAELVHPKKPETLTVYQIY